MIIDLFRKFYCFKILKVCEKPFLLSRVTISGNFELPRDSAICLPVFALCAKKDKISRRSYANANLRRAGK